MNIDPAAYLMSRTLSMTERALARRPTPDCQCAECGTRFAVGPIARCPNDECGSRRLHAIDPRSEAMRLLAIAAQEASHELRVRGVVDLAARLDERVASAVEALKNPNL